LAFRSMYCYAWDLAEAGVETVADELAGRHINTITLAGAYHAGKFLRPHGLSGKVVFPEDGTAYFRTRQELYGTIRPDENSLMGNRDILQECCELTDMDVNAWMVLMHNSRLGAKHTDCCVRNAFGDPYIYNLCPSSPAAREYAVTLCADVTDRYPVTGVSLETPGFLPYEHGYHHEFALMRQNVWLNNMLGLCFCPDCVAGAETAGIDASGLKARVADAIGTYLDADVDYADDMAAAYWTAEIVTGPDMADFLKWRCGVVESLIGEIRDAVRSDATVSVIPSVARPTSGAWYEGSDLAGLAAVADKLEVCFYEPGPDRIRSDLHDVSGRLGGTGQLRAILRPGYPDLPDAGSVMAAVDTLIEGGVEDISFYNYGHLRRPSLDWMSDALAAGDYSELPV